MEALLLVHLLLLLNGTALKWYSSAWALTERHHRFVTSCRLCDDVLQLLGYWQQLLLCVGIHIPGLCHLALLVLLHSCLNVYVGTF